MTPRTGVEITPNVKVYPRTDGRFVIFDKRLPLAVDEIAIAEAQRMYGAEVGPKGPTKQSRADEEAFANMKIALQNGFAKHEPAEDVPRRPLR